MGSQRIHDPAYASVKKANSGCWFNTRLRNDVLAGRVAESVVIIVSFE
jgi:hypothetical protein